MCDASRLLLVCVLLLQHIVSAQVSAFYADFDSRTPLFLGSKKEAKSFVKEKGGNAARVELSGDDEQLVQQSSKKVRVSASAWIPNFEQMFKFIEEHLKASRPVVIHCKQGCVHSAAVSIAFVMYKEGQTLKDAYEQILEVRPCAEELYKPYKSNAGVLSSLKEFAKTIKRTETTEKNGL